MGLSLGNFFRLTRLEGEPVRVGGFILTPLARSLTLVVHIPRVPIGGALVWIRPTAVRVEEAGSSRTVSIHNWTRILMFGIGLAAFTTSRWLASRKNG